MNFFKITGTHDAYRILDGRLSSDSIKWLIRRSLESSHFIRLCLHSNNNDLVNEMLMAGRYGTGSDWHYQPKGTISYHVLFGSLTVYFKEGSMSKTMTLVDFSSCLSEQSAPGDMNCSLRAPANVPRRNLVESDVCVFLELYSGPYNNDTVWL